MGDWFWKLRYLHGVGEDGGTDVGMQSRTQYSPERGLRSFWDGNRFRAGVTVVVTVVDLVISVK